MHPMLVVWEKLLLDTTPGSPEHPAGHWTHPLSYRGRQCLLTLFFSCTAASHLALWSTCWLPTTACSTACHAAVSVCVLTASATAPHTWG